MLSTSQQCGATVTRTLLYLPRYIRYTNLVAFGFKKPAFSSLAHFQQKYAPKPRLNRQVPRIAKRSIPSNRPKSRDAEDYSREKEGDEISFTGVRKWLKRFLYSTCIVWGGLTIYCYRNLEQVPITGRWRLNLFSTEQLVGDALEMERKREMEERKSALEQLEQFRQPSSSPDSLAATEVLQKLIPLSGMEHLDWELVVVNTEPDMMNATIGPTGLVQVYSGLLPICKDNDGLATVLSHEIAHVIAQNHIEETSGEANVAIAAIPLLPFAIPLASSAIFMGAILLCIPAAPFALTLAGVYHWACREQESEADYIGLKLMADAGFDIRQVPEFWNRMEKATAEILAKKDEKGTEWRKQRPRF